MSIPFIRHFDYTYEAAEALSPLVTRVICENPGPFTFTGSGTYLIGQNILAIIDPGPDDPAHHNALLAAINGRPVSHILITHTHLDHCGGARRLAEATGAPCYGFSAHLAGPDDAAPALDEGADFSFQPDAVLRHGSMLCSPEWQLTALYTPGHIGNHLCFALAEEKAVFTGDHVMGWATTVVAPPDGNMAQYMDSLDLLLKRDDDIYYPTHGAPIDQPKELVQGIKTHRLARDAQIISTLKEGAKSVMEIVETLYHDVDKGLHLAAGLNVMAHLMRHEKEGRAAKTGDAFQAVWRLL